VTGVPLLPKVNRNFSSRLYAVFSLYNNVSVVALFFFSFLVLVCEHVVFFGVCVACMIHLGRHLPFVTNNLLNWTFAQVNLTNKVLPDFAILSILTAVNSRAVRGNLACFFMIRIALEPSSLLMGRSLVYLRRLKR